jgi:hypothetical protein
MYGREVLVGKLETRRTLRRPRRRHGDKNNTDFKEIAWEGLDWIHLAQVREKWQALVNTVMNIRAP